MLREGSEMHSNGFLRGGIGGVAGGDVAAGGGGGDGCGCAVRFDLQLHVRQVLQLQGAFASIRFQELFDGYSSGFGHKIPHHYLYDSLFSFLRSLFACIIIYGPSVAGV